MSRHFRKQVVYGCLQESHLRGRTYKQVWIDQNPEERCVLKTSDHLTAQVSNCLLEARHSMVLWEDFFARAHYKWRELAPETFWETLYSEELDGYQSARVYDGVLFRRLITVLDRLVQEKMVVTFKTGAFARNSMPVILQDQGELSKERTEAEDEVVMMEFIHYARAKTKHSPEQSLSGSLLSDIYREQTPSPEPTMVEAGTRESPVGFHKSCENLKAPTSLIDISETRSHIRIASDAHGKQSVTSRSPESPRKGRKERVASRKTGSDRLISPDHQWDSIGYVFGSRPRNRVHYAMVDLTRLDPALMAKMALVAAKDASKMSSKGPPPATPSSFADGIRNYLSSSRQAKAVQSFLYRPRILPPLVANALAKSLAPRPRSSMAESQGEKRAGGDHEILPRMGMVPKSPRKFPEDDTAMEEWPFSTEVDGSLGQRHEDRRQKLKEKRAFPTSSPITPTINVEDTGTPIEANSITDYSIDLNMLKITRVPTMETLEDIKALRQKFKQMCLEKIRRLQGAIEDTNKQIVEDVTARAKQRKGFLCKLGLTKSALDKLNSSLGKDSKLSRKRPEKGREKKKSPCQTPSNRSLISQSKVDNSRSRVSTGIAEGVPKTKKEKKKEESLSEQGVNAERAGRQAITLNVYQRNFLEINLRSFIDDVLGILDAPDLRSYLIGCLTAEMAEFVKGKWIINLDRLAALVGVDKDLLLRPKQRKLVSSEFKVPAIPEFGNKREFQTSAGRNADYSSDLTQQIPRRSKLSLPALQLTDAMRLHLNRRRHSFTGRLLRRQGSQASRMKGDKDKLDFNKELLKRQQEKERLKRSLRRSFNCCRNGKDNFCFQWHREKYLWHMRQRNVYLKDIETQLENDLCHPGDVVPAPPVVMPERSLPFFMTKDDINEEEMMPTDDEMVKSSKLHRTYSLERMRRLEIEKDSHSFYDEDATQDLMQFATTYNYEVLGPNPEPPVSRESKKSILPCQPGDEKPKLLIPKREKCRRLTMAEALARGKVPMTAKSEKPAKKCKMRLSADRVSVSSRDGEINEFAHEPKLSLAGSSEVAWRLSALKAGHPWLLRYFTFLRSQDYQPKDLKISMHQLVYEPTDFVQSLMTALDDFVVRRELVTSDRTMQSVTTITFTRKDVFAIVPESYSTGSSIESTALSRNTISSASEEMFKTQCVVPAEK